MAGRRCAGRLAAGSRLGRTAAGLHSRFASGPRLAALRLAGPIDSLVRVSRRVGRARDNRPRTRGACDEIDTGNQRPGARPHRRHRVRSRRAGLKPDSRATTARRRSRPEGSDPGAGAARRPFLGRSAGAKRPGYRLSDRAPRRVPGLVGGTPPGRPLPATQPVAGAAPGRSARGRAPRRPRAPPPRGRAGTAVGTAPAALNLPGPICAALPFASRRLHVLLNSLFRVLFNFPSRYLCSIGLVQGI